MADCVAAKKMKRKQDFVSIKKIMRGVVKELQSHYSDEKHKVDAVWREVTGGDFADVAAVQKIHRDSVVIEVSSSAVLAELKQFYRHVFLEKLREHGVYGIERIHFKVIN
jgi:predicted nucleic acid-binding Zn ribbon protein